MLAALRFSSPDRTPLSQLSREDWKKALDFCGRTQLTLPLGLTCGEYLPEWVRSQIDRNLADNAERWRRLKLTYQEVASAFEAEGLEFVVLKGFSHYPSFVSNPCYRPQGDMDLLFQHEQALQAYDVAARLGYEPIAPFDRHPIDHLPAMIRKTGWEWRGDDSDVEMPVALELHFRFWDQPTERFEPKGLEQFWERRQSRELEELRFVALNPADAIGHSALHLLRHLLRGDLRPSHVYELAWLLHHSTENTCLWSAWSELHDETLRRLEAICFALAHRWFDCRLPAAPLDEIDHLPAEVNRWLATYATSPLAGLFHPNKDELWLHWNLVDSPGARASVLRRRLLPERLPGPVDAVHIPEPQRTLRIRLRSRWRYGIFVASRVGFHLRALPATALSALKWFGAGTGLGPQYWRFFFAEGFFDFGMFVFVFLYNLYLLQLGFRENFVGMVSGVMTAGSVAGSLLAAVAMQRFGLRRTLLFSFALTAGLSALRAYVTFGPALLGLAAAAGVASSAWPVAYAPAIAQLTTKKTRPFGFSLICSAGIAIGVLGGLVAGHLPGWLLGLHLASSSVEAYRKSLFAGCAMVLLALWRFWGVKISTAAATERKIARPSPLVVRYLAAMAVWNLGTGALNPFFNVFFARRVRLPVEQIGSIFAFSQVAQVSAILLAPLAFRRFGLIRGISGMQYATALALAGLAATRNPVWAAVIYAAYMAAQYMSEPGMFTLLMEEVSVGERGSASALNFVVSCAGQAVGAVASGALLEHFGYPPVMAGAAVICAAAALLFRVLLAKKKPDEPSIP